MKSEKSVFLEALKDMSVGVGMAAAYYFGSMWTFEQLFLVSANWPDLLRKIAAGGVYLGFTFLLVAACYRRGGKITIGF